MNEKLKIKKLYKEKVNEILKHNKFYFINDSPQISDSKYDGIKRETLLLEKKYPYLKKLGLVEKIVGAPASNKFKKIKHLRPMLSLSNAFNKNDMSDFFKKIINFLNYENKNVELFSEPKIDGISSTLIYEKGLLTRGLSRGDGITGEDILANLKTIKSIPKKIQTINVPKLLEIRCEIFINKKNFNSLKQKFANPRNAAGGSLRQKNPK